MADPAVRFQAPNDAGEGTSTSVAPRDGVSNPPLATSSAPAFPPGPVRSMRAVDAAPGEAGAHAERFPATSTDRNWARVSPCSLTITDAPAAAALQVAPPSVLVRCS